MQRETRSVKAGETDLGSGMFVKANMSRLLFLDRVCELRN